MWRSAHRAGPRLRRAGASWVADSLEHDARALFEPRSAGLGRCAFTTEDAGGGARYAAVPLTEPDSVARGIRAGNRSGRRAARPRAAHAASGCPGPLDRVPRRWAVCYRRCGRRAGRRPADRAGAGMPGGVPAPRPERTTPAPRSGDTKDASARARFGANFAFRGYGRSTPTIGRHRRDGAIVK